MGIIHFPLRPDGQFVPSHFRPDDATECQMTDCEENVSTHHDGHGGSTSLTSTVFVSKLDKTDRVREIETAFPICIEVITLSTCVKRNEEKPQNRNNNLDRAEELRERIIQVDAFEQLVHPHEELVRSTTPDEMEK